VSQPPLKPPLASTDPRHLSLQRLRRLSYLLDNSIPIPGIGRIGIDPILGLVPGAGDTVSGALAAYIVWEAARLGSPRATLVQMVWNILIETILGSVPIVGDLFDATWKANARNLALLETHFNAPRAQRRSTDWVFLTLLICVLLLIVIGFATVSVLLVRLLVGTLTGQ
jgi:hypothetical protein